MSEPYFPTPNALLDTPLPLKASDDTWLPDLDEWLHMDTLSVVMTPPNDLLGDDMPCGMSMSSSNSPDALMAMTTPLGTPFLMLPSSPQQELDLFQTLASTAPLPPSFSASALSLPVDRPAMPSSLEMVLNLDASPSKRQVASIPQESAHTKKRKLGPPSAAQPVTSHITSASTPTFSLKRPAKKRAVATPSLSAVSNGDASTLGTTSLTEQELAIKRKRNTDAARRSRQRKLHKLETLSSRVMELETSQKLLMTRVNSLQSDKSALLDKEAAYQARILQLEAQLALK
ncbi:hypothetical protein DM01DRAFT_1072789 [Hesseltinella vesiculosa]|uniref:BZIP domain-containing protein n=1 Tax=Hesseltinella vesiculosa TaxID=101127 RepID=A0A1X2GVQ9_9FUNG|nr:hypothetical protein DM01DRAFT_1072789 [Hesseltinella vesiculosa]